MPIIWKQIILFSPTVTESPGRLSLMVKCLPWSTILRKGCIFGTSRSSHINWVDPSVEAGCSFTWMCECAPLSKCVLWPLVKVAYGWGSHCSLWRAKARAFARCGQGLTSPPAFYQGACNHSLPAIFPFAKATECRPWSSEFSWRASNSFPLLSLMASISLGPTTFLGITFT